LLQEYDIQSAAGIQEALKNLLGDTIKEMMKSEMEKHLGNEKSERSDSDDYRNGYKKSRSQPATAAWRSTYLRIENPPSNLK